ncbi:related to glutamic acid decarboxylase [Phialocephala subalpina]|uniref:Related to glutamic acid decarboxylase n=1 Tax=Phialocephala subalpina TaxID=576137 RepID=A0A1L7WVG4_9HELO|nr:related to glutamic acid decarboxylase [Phialocephala subalpina]
MAPSSPIESQHITPPTTLPTTLRATPLTTSTSEDRAAIQEKPQHIPSLTSGNTLFKHFVGNSEPGDQQKALDFFNQVLDIGINFKSQPEVRQKQVKTPVTQSFDSMPEEGMTCEQLLECFNNIAQHSTNFASPKFLGFPDAANSIPALGAAMLIPFINQNMCNQDIQAPAASFIEMEVVHWLRQQIGFPVSSEYTTVTEIGGIMTAGGCLSNTVGMMAARESLFPGSGMTGLPVIASVIRVLVPDVIEHYSIRSALAWLGMGEANVVRVPVDDLYRIKIDKLERVIKDERAAGHRLLACVAYAGDSRSMRIDNLHDIGAVLRKNKIWFHVDACHGSQLAFSHTHRHKIRGIEEADSVTIDPHKVLWIPYMCSFVLFKDPKSLANVSTNSDLILKTQWSLGQITPCVGSKAFDALKLWSTIKYFGRSGIEALIDARLALTKEFQEEIDGHEETSILESGDALVHGFNLKRCSHPLLPEDEVLYVLRTINGNPLTTAGHLKEILDTVVGLGHQFYSKGSS